VAAPLGSETFETQPLPALDALLQTNFVEELPAVKGLKDFQPHAQSHEPMGDDPVLVLGPIYFGLGGLKDYEEVNMTDGDGDSMIFQVGYANAALEWGWTKTKWIEGRHNTLVYEWGASLWDSVFMHIATTFTGTPKVEPPMDEGSVSFLDFHSHDLQGLRFLEFVDTDGGGGGKIRLQQRGDASGAILEVVAVANNTHTSPTYRRLRLADPVGADDATTKRYVDALGAANHTLLDGSLHTDTVAQGATEGSLILSNATPKWDELVISVPAANVRNVLGVDNGETAPSWKAMLDGTNPANAGGAAAPGTSLIAAHRDHVHAVAANHSGSAHHAAVTIHADAAHALSTQELQAVLAASGQTGHMSGAMFDKLDGIEAAADVTDAANVAGAGAVMDSDISPGEGFLRKTGAGTYTAHKSNLAAAAAPDADEDSADGYSVGSVWIDTTNDNMYVCVDATEAAAVWLHLNAAAAAHDHTGAADGGVLTNDEHDGYSEYGEIVSPAAPAANKGRMYAVDVEGITCLAYKDPAGTETVLPPAYRFRATRNDVQAIPNATLTRVNFDDEDYDPFGDYDNAVNFRYTCPVDGRYAVHGGAGIIFGGAQATAFFASIYVNSAEVSRGVRILSGTNDAHNATVSDILDLTAADYIEIVVYQNSGGALNTEANAVSNYFSAHILSADV